MKDYKEVKNTRDRLKPIYFDMVVKQVFPKFISELDRSSTVPRNVAIFYADPSDEYEMLSETIEPGYIKFMKADSFDGKLKDELLSFVSPVDKNYLFSAILSPMKRCQLVSGYLNKTTKGCFKCEPGFDRHYYVSGNTAILRKI